MTSNLLTRRAMLSGGAMLGMSALLVACGQQANNEAAATASATPTETTSASAAASGSPSASATPSTVRGYSGGSKAPDGEYRKADAKGPAQNVPKPAAPEEGYREKSTSGLEKTIRAWMNFKNYAIQTGDYSDADKFVSPAFESEYKIYQKITDLYRRGGWVIDGLAHLMANGAPWSEDGETYIWRVYREWHYAMYVQPDGSWETRENSEQNNNMWDIKLRHNGERWLIEATTKVKE